MKKIIILEDKPHLLEEFIHNWNNDVNNQARRVTEVLYYDPDLEQEDDKIAALSEQLGVDTTVVNLWNFKEVMNQRYDDADTIFIFDVEITREQVFIYNMNISYALTKMKYAGAENYKIWFYTAAGPEYEKNIEDLFSDYVIPAKCEERQLRFDLQACKTFCKAVGMEEN